MDINKSNKPELFYGVGTHPTIVIDAYNLSTYILQKRINYSFLWHISFDKKQSSKFFRCSIPLTYPKNTHLHFVETHLYFVETHLHFVETHLYFVETHLYFVETHLYFVETHLHFVESHLHFVETYLYFVESHLHFVKTHLHFVERLLTL